MKFLICLMLFCSTAIGADFTLSPDQIAALEKQNKARFIRDYVGKTVQMTGTVENIGENHFTFKAKNTFAGWTVYHNQDFLANLDVGKKVSVTCIIKDMPLIGGALDCN